MGISLHRGPVREPVGGLVYLGPLRQMKEGSGNGASLWELCKWNLEEAILYWGP